MSTEEKLKLEDLIGATIVGYDWTGRLGRLQLKLRDGRLVILRANGEVSDKRFRVFAWLEIFTSEIREDLAEKLL